MLYLYPELPLDQWILQQLVNAGKAFGFSGEDVLSAIASFQQRSTNTG